MKTPLAALAALSLSFFASLAHAELKIATVDLDAVFKAHPKVVKAQAEIDKRRDEYAAIDRPARTELSQLQQQAQTIREEAQNPMLSDQERAQKQEQFRRIAMRAQQLERGIQENNQKMQQELVPKLREVTGSVRETLEKMVADYAKENGYDLIINTNPGTANAVPTVAFATDEMDVTEALVAIVKKEPAE